MGITFEQLPIDVLLHVLSFLPVRDIIRIRQTCTSLFAVTHLHPVWLAALHTHFLEKDLPVPGLSSLPSPGLSASLLSVSELERRTVRALRLRENWLSSYPSMRHRTEIIPVPQCGVNQRTRNVGLSVLNFNDKSYLCTITGHSAADRRDYTVQLWDLGSGMAEASVKCVAELQLSWIVSICFNTKPGDHAPLGITRKSESHNIPLTTTIYNLDLSDTTGPEDAFKPSTQIPRCRRPHVFQGFIVVGSDENDVVGVWNAKTGKQVYELRDPSLSQQRIVCLTATYLEEQRLLVLFRTNTIEFYIIPELSSSDATSDAPNSAPKILQPYRIYIWQWRIDTVLCSLDYRTLSSLSDSGPDASRFPDIHLFIRFDSWFPWPVNLLHHFLLCPDADTHSSGPSVGQDIPYLSTPDQKPILLSSISSSVRLFSPSAMVLGSRGSAIWLDTQAEGDLGQRIAGKMLFGTPESDCIALLAKTDRLASGSSATSIVRTFIPVTNAEEGGYVKREERTEGAEMVFETREEADPAMEWDHLAMDEDNGRIIVGRDGGGVEIWDYAP